VIIGHARAGHLRIDISGAIVAETVRVLRDMFRWDGYSLQDARRSRKSFGKQRSGVGVVTWRSAASCVRPLSEWWAAQRR